MGQQYHEHSILLKVACLLEEGLHRDNGQGMVCENQYARASLGEEEGGTVLSSSVGKSGDIFGSMVYHLRLEEEAEEEGTPVQRGVDHI